MAQRKTLRQEVDELRGEIAALRAERAVAAEAAKPAPVPQSAPETTEETMLASIAGRSGELEEALSELVATTETQIGEHPTLAAGLAFLAGIAIGRLSKG